MREVLRTAVDMAQPSVDHRRQVFVWIPSDQPMAVSGDRVRLQQVFSNLLLNASKYTPEGGTIELGDLFTAFRGDKMQPLLIIGALLLVFGVAIVAVAGLLGLAAVSAGALSLAYVALYLRGGPRIIDATSYWLQARAIASGWLAAWPLGEPRLHR